MQIEIFLSSTESECISVCVSNLGSFGLYLWKSYHERAEGGTDGIRNSSFTLFTAFLTASDRHHSRQMWPVMAIIYRPGGQKRSVFRGLLLVVLTEVEVSLCIDSEGSVRAVQSSPAGL